MHLKCNPPWDQVSIVRCSVQHWATRDSGVYPWWPLSGFCSIPTDETLGKEHPDQYAKVDVRQWMRHLVTYVYEQQLYQGLYAQTGQEWGHSKHYNGIASKQNTWKCNLSLNAVLKYVKFWSKTFQLHYAGRQPSAAGFDTWPHEKTFFPTGDNDVENGFLQTYTQQSKVFFQLRPWK